MFNLVFTCLQTCGFWVWFCFRHFQLPYGVFGICLPIWFVFHNSCQFDIFFVLTAAIPGVMDRAAISGCTVEQLLEFLLAIVIELCSRFRIPVSTAAPAAPAAPDLESPPARFCRFHCRFCQKACGRSKPRQSQLL